MKRSEINAVIKKFEALLAEYKFALPPYLDFTPEEWATKGHEYDEIRDNMLGWDVTDYGEGNFDTLGLALITIRNGNVNNPKYTKPYAEKIIMCDSGQVSPLHFHWNKMEDIINRGGGNVVFKLWNADRKTEQPLDTYVKIFRDGREYTVPAGSEVTVTEIYSGASYKVTTEAMQKVEIVGGESVITNVENTYDERLNGCSGIVNSFLYDSESDEWIPSQAEDSTP